jgi:ectoine hydroxylase
MFFGYTYRWIALRDQNQAIWPGDLAGRLSPIQRQLLGGLPDTDGDHA